MGLRRCRAIVSWALLGLSLVPGRASGAEHSTNPRPPEEFAAADRRPTALEDLLRGIVDAGPSDAHARSRALRTLLSERWGGPTTATLPPGAAAEELEFEYNAWPEPADDLDGDGLTDVLVTAWTYPDEFHLAEALRGSDGAVLWSVESTSWRDGMAWPAGVDLTGDGTEDMLIWGLVRDDPTSGGTCVTDQVFNCTRWSEATYTSVLGVRSGVDGSLVWSTSYEGRERFEQTHSGGPVSEEYTEHAEATNAFVVPYLIGDRDGDGARDLVVNAIDVRWDKRYAHTDVVVAGSAEGNDIMRFNTRAELISGATGVSELRRSVEDAPLVGELRPTDETGADLLWTTWSYPDEDWSCEYLLDDAECSGTQIRELTGDLEMLDAATLETRWARGITRDDMPIPLRVDLTGDGHAEILLDHFPSWLDAEGRFLDGATGEELWVREGFWTWEVVPSLDGAGGVDLVIVSVGHGDEVSTGSAERVDGATGETLVASSLTLPWEGADQVYLWALPVGDVSGDGVPDLAWHGYRLWNDEVCEEDSSESRCWFFTWRVASTLRAEDTRTAATLHASNFPNEYAALRGAGDITDDGTGDLLRMEAGEGPADYVGLDGRTGEEAWRTAVDTITFLTPGGDQTGDGRGDLVLESLSDRDGARTSWVGAVDGAGGAVAWTRRYG